MNRKELNEIRRRFNIEKNNLTCIRGCYVNEKRDIVSMFNRPLMSFPQEEAEKYLAFFRRVFSGIPGKNLLTLTFDAGQVMEGEEHKLLSGLRNTGLKVEEGVQAFYQRVIDSLELEGNYLILMAHDAYDLPFRSHDENKADEESEEMFTYITCCVCPVKLTKPALSYFAEDNDFHDREPNWVVGSPELGFMFPAFDDRAANLSAALYYTRDASDVHGSFIDAVFGTERPVPADSRKEAFQSVLEDALGEDLDMDVVQTVHEQLRTMIEDKKSDKEAEAPTVTKREVKDMLTSCGVSEEHMAAFDERFDEKFGSTGELGAQAIVDEKKFEVRTPNVVIHVDPEHTDLLKTRVIDGRKYIMIAADDGVMVNGLNISIAGEE